MTTQTRDDKAHAAALELAAARQILESEVRRFLVAVSTCEIKVTGGDDELRTMSALLMAAHSARSALVEALPGQALVTA